MSKPTLQVKVYVKYATDEIENKQYNETNHVV